MLVHGLPALGFGEMLAIRGRPQKTHRPSGADLHGVNIPHAGLNVLSARVVGAVHEYCIRVVVDGDIDWPPGRQLYARRRSAASGKAVDYEFSHSPRPPSFCSYFSRVPLYLRTIARSSFNKSQLPQQLLWDRDHVIP